MKLSIVLTLATLPSALASSASSGYKRTPVGQYVSAGCKHATEAKAAFCKKSHPKRFECQCTNENALASLVYCAYKETEHDPKERHSFEESFIETCKGKVTQEGIEAAYNRALKKIVSVKDIPNFNKTIPVKVPVKHDHAAYVSGYRTKRSRSRNKDDALEMSFVLLCFWGLVTVLSGLAHVSRRMAPRLWMSASRSLNSVTAFRKLRQYVTMPATHRGKHTEKYGFLGFMPTRLESVIIFIFVTLSVVFHAVRYEYVYPNTVYKTRHAQMGRLVGDRSGMLANCLFVLTWLFASRNSIILAFTGWKQSTMLTYHKAIARTAIASTLVHTISMLVHTLDLGRSKYTTRSQTGWWRWGSVATVAACVILIQAQSWFRMYSYEIFLYLHILLAVFVLAGAWMHTAWFSDEQWYFACAALWCFDRFIRLVRMGYFGFRTAHARVLSAENGIFELVVPKHKAWIAFPGSVAYVYFLGTPLFWQSHPFTIAPAEDGKLRFVIKAKRGATAHILRRLLASPDQSASFRVCVEGPYGNYAPIKHYDHLLLYAGGSGIPGPLCYAKHLGELGLSSRVPFVKLYWVVRHAADLDWYKDDLTALARYSNIQPIVYITRPDSASPLKAEADSLSDDDSEGRACSPQKEGSLTEVTTSLLYSKQFAHVEFRYNRPDTSQLIAGDMADLAGASVAVMSCASPNMVDDIRAAVALAAGSYKSSTIDYYEELQVW
ncbi:ABR154Cp [Eremothecium gossypii ATCC 10895]|uniref:ferric-chelate reductase (NADPH) n=1 Tax=Eremothecium gossypii (strain ATCC 10895 / CBS 109.51 / FGSC 9923 / NRRL Y-1056) TaxID=284811 RepID=Q75D69_EREGS|nr:ABR154Cp [Eremothecium gossypii ATCC 10895]AAS50926.1 ABR154Cp [Eremothecium gossypii ATCC 10895]AEY95215.1 FABR154Cp [Eremothecium gossypii FDAG1]